MVPDLPSTILPANTTQMPFAMTTQQPTECRYALGDALTYDQMTPFLTSGGLRHEVILSGLSPDPNTVNRVHVRCAAFPDEVLSLKYRSLSSVNPSFPRTGNLWGSWNFTDEGLAYASRIDLWLGAHWNPDEIRQLRQLNPATRVLTSYNAVELGLDGWQEPPPDDFWLQDINGNRIEVWPGAYRVNMTRLDVAEYMARNAYQLILDSDLMLDGIFIDNIFVRASWFTEDIYGNPFPIDADQDGVQDDPVALDAAWRAGLMHQLRTLRQLLPYALLNGHAMDINDPELAAIFNGTSIGFDVPYVIEGRMTFSDLWTRYTNWMTLAVPPREIMIESAVPVQIGYGYGFLPLNPGHMPPETLAFARDYYPYMRFGLALTLMQDGYFAHEIGDTYHGNDWWYDELDFDLGYPLKAANFIQSGSQQVANLVKDGDFDDRMSVFWSFWANTDAGAAATFTRDLNDKAQSRASARIDVASVSGQNWHIEFSVRDLALEQDRTYQVKFWAKASAPRSISLSSQKSSPDWDNYGLWQSVNLDTQWREYTLTFTASASANDARLQFLLGESTGSVWLDNIQLVEGPPAVMQRAFTNGLVLLNATRQPQTVRLAPGYRRLVGNQAAYYEYIVDDIAPDFSVQGNWQETVFDSDEWKALGPYYHDWGPGSHLGNGAARWELDIPEADTYTLTVWWPAAPQASSWSSNAVYEVVSEGQVVASATFDQRMGGDVWHTVGQARLVPGAYVQLRCEGGAPCLADAVHVRSARRFNDGSAADVITLQPMDGIILQRVP